MALGCTMEAYRVGVAKGIPFNFDDPHTHVSEFAATIPNASPSMRLDHLAGRPSEIDVINGQVVELSRELGLGPPTTRPCARSSVSGNLVSPDRRGRKMGPCAAVETGYGCQAITTAVVVARSGVSSRASAISGSVERIQAKATPHEGHLFGQIGVRQLRGAGFRLDLRFDTELVQHSGKQLGPRARRPGQSQNRIQSGPRVVVEGCDSVRSTTTFDLAWRLKVRTKGTMSTTL